MKPEIWGPHAWIFLHSITLEYPDNPTREDKSNMANFFNSLGNVLPCHKCRINFDKHLERYPLTDKVLSCKANLIKWLIDIHNCVNRINNKKELTYEESLQKILDLYNKQDYAILYFGIVLIFITILFTLFKMLSPP